MLLVTIVSVMPLRASAVEPKLQKIAEEILKTTTIHSFQETHEYALKILESCPPEKCILLSLGISNTLQDSFLRYYIKKNNWSDTYLKYAPYRRIARLGRINTEFGYKMVDTLLRQILPSDQELAGKTLAILRHLDSGASVNLVFFKFLQEFMRQNDLSWKVVGFFSIQESRFQLASSELSRDWPKWDFYFRNTGTRLIDVNRSYREIDYTHYRYKTIDLRNDFDPKSPNLVVKENPKYLELDRLTQLFIEDKATFMGLAPDQKSCKNWLKHNASL